MLAKIQPDTNIKVLSGPFAACRDSKKNLQKELYMDSITYSNFRTIVAILKGEKVQKKIVVEKTKFLAGNGQNFRGNSFSVF